MKQLPADFISYTRDIMGDERFSRYLKSFDEDVPVSIRLNPLKLGHDTWEVIGGEPVGWCPEGYYLPRRPQFTMDPLLHAGCYYVQEAASMFVSHVLRQYVTQPVKMLDLCAAPGGKSTAAIASVPAGSTLYSNEPMRQRASVLLENITKWGYPDCTVTNGYPADYRKAKLLFDVILCDVPCSGEGMFRRDEETIGEWSPQQVEKCRLLQRDIVGDAWACLQPGGLLVYSTCTFNTKENEENVRWLLDTFDDASVLPVETRPEWAVTGSLLPGFTEPVYRFIPGITRSEGLFLCVVRKAATATIPAQRPARSSKLQAQASPLHVLPPPSAGAADDGPVVGLDYARAIAFLRGEALALPAETPRGVVAVAFEGHRLGMMKNIGTRANNLYPKEWRIKTTHIPQDYEAILRHT